MKIFFCTIVLSAAIIPSILAQAEPVSPARSNVRVTPTPTPGNVSRNSSVYMPAVKDSAHPNSSSLTSAGAGREDTFANGARAKLLGNTLVIIDPSGHQTSFKRTGPAPPAHPNMKLTSRCLKLKHWLDANSCNSPTWRRVCNDYFDNCE